MKQVFVLVALAVAAGSDAPHQAAGSQGTLTPQDYAR
jgi:hypothetical protein